MSDDLVMLAPKYTNLVEMLSNYNKFYLHKIFTVHNLH